MFESFGFETLTAPQAAVYFALGLGLVFGILAQITRFCLRRALVGDDRRQAAGVWLAALATAVLGTQGAVAIGWVDFSEHRFLSGDLPILGVALGGLMFGAGMVLTRGCISRLTVLSGGGNLRALTVLLVFAIVAHAAIKGVLAPLRTALSAPTLPLDQAALPGHPLVWAGLIAVAALAFALRSGNRASTLLLALGIGALVPLGWVGTGFVLYDDFDLIALQSLAFTGPSADALFYTVAATAMPANFGTGLIAGVLGGALLTSLLSGQFRWQSFDSPAQTGRYFAGAALMGFGGALAGGCTVGAGLAGVPTLSIAAILALAAIAAGALATGRALGPQTAPAATHMTPAE